MLKFSMLSLIAVSTISHAQVIFEVSPDEANKYGIFSYNITEDRSSHRMTRYTVQSQSAGMTFTITEGSSNGSRQLKSALQKPQSLRKETQAYLFRVGTYLAKAQNLEEKMKARFDDFDFEVQRLQSATSQLQGQVPSQTYQQVALLKQQIQTQIAQKNRSGLISSYESILRILGSNKSDTNQVSRVQDLIASIERTQSTIEGLKKDIQRDQMDFISFSQEIEANELISQQLKIRTVTAYLRSVAQTLHAYIGQTDQRLQTLKNIQAQAPQIDSSVMTMIHDLQNQAFRIRAQIPSATAELNAIDAKYGVFYSPTGALLKLSQSKSSSENISFAQSGPEIYFCENRICTVMALQRLQSHPQYAYSIQNSHHILINTQTLDALVLTEQNLADVSKTLECTGGFNTFSKGASSVLQSTQIVGWAIAGGIGESAVNAYRWANDEPTNYNYTSEKIEINKKEKQQADEAYARLQQTRKQALDKFMTQFHEPLLELGTDSPWSDSLLAKSKIVCE